MNKHSTVCWNALKSTSNDSLLCTLLLFCVHIKDMTAPMTNTWFMNQTWHFCVTSLEINFTIYFTSNKYLIGMSLNQPAANQNPFPTSGLTKLTSEFMAV